MSQNISFAEAVKSCFNKYADFNGRSPRAEYWYFALFNVAVVMVLAVLGAIIGKLFMYVYYAYVLAILVPSIAVSIRRMHDIGRSGWWVLISLVPFIGSIWYIVLAALPSQLGPNQYGPNPYGQDTIA
jgi:Predicted membrane protein